MRRPRRAAADAMGLVERCLGTSSRFLGAYYVLNAAVLLAYPALRFMTVARKSALPTVTPQSLGEALEELRGWEQRALGTLTLYGITKMYRFSTPDAFVSQMFMLAKVAMLVLCWKLDTAAFVWGLVAVAALFVSVPQPEYEGPTKVEYFTPGSFQDLVVDGRADCGWVVQFYAGWAHSCRHIEPLMAALSNKYSSKDLRFGKLDVGRWPHLAEKHKVSVGVTSKQLPTIALFQGGDELGRIPHVFEDGKISKPRFTEKHIAACFELDKRLKRSEAAAHAAAGKAKKAGGAQKPARDKKDE